MMYLLVKDVDLRDSLRPVVDVRDVARVVGVGGE